MPDYSDESHQQYSQTMQEHGFEDMGHEDGLDDAIDELMNDMQSLPQKIQQLLEYLMQGYDFADAAYYAGYGNNTEGLHKALKTDNGQGTQEKLQTLKTAHTAGRERADATQSASADSGF